MLLSSIKGRPRACRRDDRDGCGCRLETSRGVLAHLQQSMEAVQQAAQTSKARQVRGAMSYLVSTKEPESRAADVCFLLGLEYK